MDESSNPESNAKASAFSFSVDFNDQPKKAKRKPPKHLLERHKKKEISQETIEEKQRKAEDRRKVSIPS